MFSGSFDSDIKQWLISSSSSSTTVLIRTLCDHSMSVNALATSGNQLFSGSADATVKQWQLNSGGVVYLLNSFSVTTAVKGLAVSGEFFYTGDSIWEIKQWSISGRSLVRTFSGHSDSVNGLDLSGDYLFSGSNDKQWCGNNYYQSGSRCLVCPANAVCSSVKDFNCKSGYYKSGSVCELCTVYNSVCPTVLTSNPYVNTADISDHYNRTFNGLWNCRFGGLHLLFC